MFTAFLGELGRWSLDHGVGHRDERWMSGVEGWVRRLSSGDRVDGYRGVR